MSRGRPRLFDGLSWVPGLFRATLQVVLVAFALALALPALAQTPPKVDETGALVPNTGGRAANPSASGPGLFAPQLPVDGASGLNYDDWAAMAERAERLVANSRTSAQDLDTLRGLLVDWREALLGAQSANSTRIAVIRSQIAALGPVPVEGVTESEEIAGRRSELTDQLVRLQAPGIKADEAYERANGLILEIDRQRRDRQAEAMLRLWPSALNPANWPAGVAGLSTVAVTLASETAQQVSDPRAQGNLVNNLPLIALLIVFGLAIIWRGRAWLDRVLTAMPMPRGARGARLLAFVASFGQIIVPVLGLLALETALRRSDMLGPLGLALTGVLPVIGLIVFTAIWIGGQVFSETSVLREVAALSPEQRAEGRFLAFACGFLLAISRIRGVIFGQLDLDERAASVLLFPILLLGGIILVRVGRLLTAVLRVSEQMDDDGTTVRRLFGVISKAAVAIGVVGPVLAAIGYNSAAASLIQPAALSLGLIGLLAVSQQVLYDLWALISRDETAENNTLVPVLMGFGLALGSVPVLALIWGANVADLTELWARFQGGFTLGEARISPMDFFLFLVLFLIGLTVTRLIQGVLKGQILPRTGMDQGGRNAVAVGFGYFGVFLSGLIAVNATGIDLSGLAIVAGALSLGIGFGLQAIVSNFVSGIILLIERPVSEGDWIEVGTVSGIVQAISVRSTRIQTFDRADVIVPNQDLITGRVTNWTRFNRSGRVIVPVTVPFTADDEQVSRLLMEVAESQPMVLRTPAPIVALMGFTAEAMNFELRVIVRDVYTVVQARSEINHEILRRFRAEGIAFTNLHRDFMAKTAEDAAEVAELAEREADLALWLAEDQQTPRPAPRAPKLQEG